MSLMFSAAVMLFSGTVASIVNKVLFDLSSEGQCDNSTFTKPYFMTLAMFCGEALCLLIYQLNQWKRRRLIHAAIQQQIEHKNWQPPTQATERDVEADAEADGEIEGEVENADFNPLSESRLPLLQNQATQGRIQTQAFIPTNSLKHSAKSNETQDKSPGATTDDQQLTLTHSIHIENYTSAVPLSHSTLSSSSSCAVVVSKPSVFVYCVLSCFDLSATSVSGVGLEFISASTNQMLRGSAIVFVAMFSIPLLNRRLSFQQCLAIVAVVMGLILVGLSGLLRGEEEAAAATSSSTSTIPIPTNSSSDNAAPVAKQILGCFLVLLGTAINSLQNVIEEKLMKNSLFQRVTPMEIVGWEGVFGTLISAFMLLPITQHLSGSDCGGVAENTVDSLQQLQHRPLLIVLVLCYIFSLSAMNYYSMEISRLTSAVHRNLISAARCILVWACSIFMFYTSSQHLAGEQIDIFSLLQLLGFITLAVGTIHYSKQSNNNRSNKHTMQTPIETEARSIPAQHTKMNNTNICKN